MIKVVLVLALVAYASSWEFSRLYSEQELLDKTHEFRVELKQRNLEQLRSINERVSDPKNADFGKYLTQSQIRDLVGAPNSVHRAVKNWARAESCNVCPIETRVGPHGDYMWVKSCLARLQCLFKTNFVEYTLNSAPVTRAVELKEPEALISLLPVTLQSHVTRIVRVADLPVPLRRQGAAGPEFKGDHITPAIIQNTYETGKYSLPSGASGPQGTQACGEFQYDYWKASDLIAMQKHFNQPPVEVNHIIGKDSPSSPFASLDEASLDFQYITTSVGPIETWAFVEPGFDFDLVEYCQKVAATKDAPYVHSLSYGGTESSLGFPTIERTSDEFLKMTTQGYTLIAASGDDGTGSSSFYNCPSFDPLFPATSPYITSVGATYLSDGTECSISFSGSGFSNVFTRPSYQDSYVTQYFDSVSKLPDASKYNNSGRGIPDVSAFGTNFEVFLNGEIELVAGTSAATPVFAAMVSYANLQRQSNGQAALGNINPRLYASGKVGTDITCGYSKANECSEGFSTNRGWDPATGLGTPLASVLYPLLTQ